MILDDTAEYIRDNFLKKKTITRREAISALGSYGFTELEANRYIDSSWLQRLIVVRGVKRRKRK